MMVFATLPYVFQNYENIPKWKAKNWTHGKTDKNQGKKIAHHEQWKEIADILEAIDVEFVFNSKGATHADILRKAQSMALLPKN